jgi:ubiquinone/menaquinone biosynthesis C-methylase UbiE
MDLQDYYDHHWTELPEGEVDFDRLRMIVRHVEPGMRVLEAGCGPGFLAKLLKDRGADVIGTARRGVPTRHVDLDTMTLPFADQSFDTVVCNSNLEHLFYLDDNVAECLRVLKVGGTFIWMEPNTGHWRYRLWLLFGRFPYIPNSPTDPYHIRHVTAYELRRHCERNGLVVEELLGHAGLWCRALYPSWFYARGIARVVHAVYPALVRLRPSVFARYLFVRAVKREHVPHVASAPRRPAAEAAA